MNQLSGLGAGSFEEVSRTQLVRCWLSVFCKET
jgi:hypothetical protein